MDNQNLLKTKIDGKFYMLKHQLGSGSFGTIYLGQRDDETQEIVAIKCESAKSANASLQNEARILQTMQGKVGIPKMYYSGELFGFNVMVFELLGPSLEDMFNICERKLSLKTVLQIADQLISRIETLHSRGYIHRDIKPENFLLGLGRSSHIVYLIDFGLGKRYKDSRNNQHIPYRENKSLVGTARYATVNSHLGMEQSRRDDIESIGYLIVYLLKGTLPWQGVKAVDKQDKYTKIMEKKLNTCSELLCKNLPVEFAIYLNYARNLKYEDKPDYLYLRKMFKELFFRRKFEWDYMYDWCQVPDYINPNEEDIQDEKFILSHSRDNRGQNPIHIKMNVKPLEEQDQQQEQKEMLDQIQHEQPNQDEEKEDEKKLLESDYNRGSPQNQNIETKQDPFIQENQQQIQNEQTPGNDQQLQQLQEEQNQNKELQQNNDNNENKNDENQNQNEEKQSAQKQETGSTSKKLDDPNGSLANNDQQVNEGGDKSLFD